MTELNVGSMAPDFELPTDGGGTIRLSDKKGQPVVVYFYPKDDTSSCTKEAIAFSQLKREFDAIGVKIVGISPDASTRHDKFKTKYDLKITLASDTQTSVADAYGVWKEKSMYGRKYMGIERSTFLIDREGKIARIWRAVKVPGHAEAVLEAAREL